MNQTAPLPDALRVIFNGRFLAQPLTGVQRFGRETLRAIDRRLAVSPMVVNGLPVRFEIAVPGAADTLDLVSIPTVRLGRLAGHLWEQWTLARFARSAWLVNFGPSGPMLMSRQIVTHHDARVAVHPGAYRFAYLAWQRTLLANHRRRVARFHTVSEFSKRQIVERFGIDADRISVGREGGEHLARHQPEDSVLSRHGLRPGSYMLCVGRHTATRDVHGLAAAITSIPGYPYRLVVTGERDPRVFPSSSGPAERGGDGSMVVNLGNVSDGELRALYRHAAWCVVPSVAEGFGLPAVEAMANGCPVLAARAGALPEVCGDAAHYYEPFVAGSLRDALRRIVADPQLATASRRQASTVLALQNWDAGAKVLLDVISGCLLSAADSAAQRSAGLGVRT